MQTRKKRKNGTGQNLTKKEQKETMNNKELRAEG